MGVLTPMFVIGLGLLVGIQHAFETDHIAAMSTQMLKSKQDKKQFKQLIINSITKSSFLGIIWGAGHTTALVLIGFLIYALTIPIHDSIFEGFEFLVGIMLVFLGISTIFNKKIQFKHKHPHQHKDGTVHLDEHNHENSNHKHTHKSYLIGLVHGLAGSGSLVVLSAIALDDVGMILGFIVVFGVGSMIGMAFVGSLMGVPLAFTNRITSIQKILKYAAGIFSVIIGINIMYPIGIFGYLFGI
jgi:sulfite exporter TauE/SafE